MKNVTALLLVLICLVLTLPICFAQEVTFSDQILITGQTLSPKSVFSADLDGDGDMDLLSASYEDNKIAWYENTNGLGSFGPQQTITTSADEALSVFSADLDGDGDCDVLSASYDDDKIAWYENTDGLGSFGPQQIITTSAWGACSVFSADLDGDGDYDVLSASCFDGKIAWYRNEGITSVIKEPEMLPVSYKMMPIYPNPFNPSTSVTVSLPEAANLRVNVFNVTGRLVTELVNGQFPVGNHSFTFEGSDLASGIYFIQATVPGRMSEVRKIVLMR